MTHSAALYKRITGVEPPRSFASKSAEEHAKDRERFLALVHESQNDSAIDELFKDVRLDPKLHASNIYEDEQAHAA